MKEKLRKYIGDKQFYKTVFAIIIPVMIQQLFLNIGGYVDSLMINEYNYDHTTLIHEAYNGVSAANKIMLVINFIFIGLAEGGSIFIAQFYGAKNKDKIKESACLAFIVEFLFGILTFLFIMLFGNKCVNSFIDSSSGRQYGYDYLNIIKYGTIITAINLAFASSFRSIEKPKIALYASSSGVIINVILNYAFIFGNLGAPELGAGGAALATVLSRLLETIIYIFIIIFYKNDNIHGMFKHLKISGRLIKQYIIKVLPLVTNEILFSLSLVLYTKFYCYHNDTWYSAYANSQNITDLFFIIFSGLGNGTAVLIGSSLGQGDFIKAEQDAHRLKFLGILLGVGIGIIMIITSPFISKMFKPSDEVYKICVQVLIASAIFLSMYAYNSVCFFILRAGGDSVNAFIVDQFPSYFIGIPLTILLGVNATNWGLSLIFIFVVTHISDVIKIFIANHCVNKKKWLNNLTTKA